MVQGTIFHLGMQYNSKATNCKSVMSNDVKHSFSHPVIPFIIVPTVKVGFFVFQGSPVSSYNNQYSSFGFLFVDYGWIGYYM